MMLFLFNVQLRNKYDDDDDDSVYCLNLAFMLQDFNKCIHIKHTHTERNRQTDRHVDYLL